jgi:uncharacterized protein YfbU (UPF0304 family)
MKLTNQEKLILMMLADIHEALKIKDGVDTTLLKRAIYTDNTWALESKMSHFLTGPRDPPPPAVKTVSDILEMWMLLEQAYERFGPADKARIKIEADPFGDPVRFTGFGGNHEQRALSIAQFLVDAMGMFSHFKGRDLDSHFPGMEGDLRMFSVFEPIHKTLGMGGLTADQVILILNARRHPENTNWKANS